MGGGGKPASERLIAGLARVKCGQSRKSAAEPPSRARSRLLLLVWWTEGCSPLGVDVSLPLLGVLRDLSSARPTVRPPVRFHQWRRSDGNDPPGEPPTLASDRRRRPRCDVGVWRWALHSSDSECVHAVCVSLAWWLAFPACWERK